MTHSKDQGHAYFDSEYLGNGQDQGYAHFRL